MPAARAALRALLLLALAAPPLAAQRTTSLDDLKQLVGVGGTEISPDGKTVVVAVSRTSFERNKFESELWAVDVATGARRQLTFERRSVGQARFSPDGRTLAFLAPDSAGQMQIWLMPMEGGETRRLTSHPTGVQHYSWRPDGGAIAYAAADEPAKREGDAAFLTSFRVGDQDLYLHEPLRPQHIWVVGTADGASRRLTSGDWSLELVLPPSSPPSRLSWSPDGESIAFAAVPAAESGRFDSVHVQLLDVATGEIRPLTPARAGENNPVFAPDGKAVAYWYPRDGRCCGVWENEVWLAPVAGGTPRSLTRALDRNLFGAQWMPDGRSLLVAGNDRTSVGAWIQPVDGPAKRLDLGDLVVNGAFGYDLVVAAKKPVIAFTATTPDRPSELYVLDTPTAKPRRLTDFNAWAGEVRWGKLERVTWRSDDFEADGVVGFPPDFSPERRYPLVLLIHGGPQYASRVAFSWLAQLMAAQGWIVFQPNYRGSDNLGNAYMAAIVNDAGAGPGRDVMRGVTMLRARPYVDPKRTAVTGWSYGGFMTSWLIGNYPDEWQAAMAGAPVTDWEDMYNFSDGNVLIRYSFDGSPWTPERQQAYREQSPITYASKIRTPTLVMTNIEDFRVPPTQAFALYRAMKDRGVETEMVAFGGRTHNSADPVNVRERSRLWVEWVKRHLEPLTP